MRTHFLLSLAVIVGLCTANIPNPFSNTYAIRSGGQVAQPAPSNLPNYTYTAPAPAPAPVAAPVPAPVQTTTVATSTNSTNATAAHTHAPVANHTHAAPAPAPVPAPAPAPAPALNPALLQNLTMPQIFSYLVGPYGPAVGNDFTTQSTNTLVQCKTYCDSLPESPVCDSANTLYRNECEAKCIHRTVSTPNVRYGMCCCDDTSFDYENGRIVHDTVNNGTASERNICITDCIFNCFGGGSEIEAEHSDVDLVLVNNSGGACNEIVA